MKEANILIIGGSAGGLTAAISARRNYPDKKITLVRKEREVVIPCGIPYIFKTVGAVEKDLIPDTVLDKNKVELIVDEVIQLDQEGKSVRTAGGEEVRYEKLILAIGSGPVVPPIGGVELENVFPVKKDAEYLRKVSKVLEKAEEIVVIGGGFIGVEVADELAKAGKKVTIVEMLPHCLATAFDREFCEKAEEKLVEGGVKIMTNSMAQEIGGNGSAEYVELKNGEKLPADAVILGIGARANTKLAEEAGLEIGETKAIKVNEYQQTSDENIFAVGDCAEKRFFFTGKPVPLRLASIAAREARIAAANLFELQEMNGGVIGTFSTVIGDLALGAVGLTERQAQEAKIGFVKGEATAKDKHPGAMPGCREVSVKLLFDKKGVIIGGQIAGGVSVGEMTNVIAAMIQNKMTAGEIVKLQVGTHPALTPSPIAYPIVNAAGVARSRLKR